MRVSLKWLKEYVDFDLAAEDLAHRLTMAGIEVGSIEQIGQDWENVYVGHVTSVDTHPNADRLRLATVDLGEEKITVVCGAPNIAPKQNIAFAKIGALLTDSDTGEKSRLKAARIRGIPSEGMVCSERELGLGEDHSGILVLPEDAPIGIPLETYMGDIIFDLDVTPNRPDCFGMLGIAWEVAAITGNPVNVPKNAFAETDTPISKRVSVDIMDPDLCLRYTATLIDDLKIGPSPVWMQQRLIAAGFRPINNLVDITNYVMMEYGQPLHAFDFSTLTGGKVIVRRGKTNEPMTTLDGEERTLSTDDLIIADAEHPVGLAGIIGGGPSEVTETTTSVLLESATFAHTAIRRTSSMQRVRTEASLRFEKGLNPELSIQALRRATELFVNLADGKPAKGYIDEYPGMVTIEPIQLGKNHIKRVLGIEISIEEAISIFTRLGLQASTTNPETIEVKPPFWRSDLAIPEDLIEELARTIGYDVIPITLPISPFPSHEPDPMGDLKNQIRHLMIGAGLQEIITYSLVSEEMLNLTAPENLFTPVRIWNPQSEEQEYLRTTLRANLLKTFSLNQRNVESGLKLFEIGRIYGKRDNELPEEREILAAILGGQRSELSWQGEDRDIDFFDAKGLLEHILGHFNIVATFEAAQDPVFHPGRSAVIIVENTPVGHLAEMHPNLNKKFEIDTEPVAYFELDIEAILPHIHDGNYQPATRFPAVVRDLSFIVDTETPSGSIHEMIRTFPSVVSVVLFDIYSGDQIPSGKKSCAFRVMYQNPTRTLTDDEVDIAQRQLLEKLQREIGATLRD